MAVALQKKYGVANIALSHGDKGCFVATKEDAFHAGMIYGYMQGWDMQQTTAFANACGARSGMSTKESSSNNCSALLS